MNGRIYDPLIGRMLSADVLVQSVGDLQSYNRYSYVRNRPLTSIDPSGFADMPANVAPLVGMGGGTMWMPSRISALGSMMGAAQQAGHDPQKVVTAGDDQRFKNETDAQAKGAIAGVSICAAPVLATELATTSVVATATTDFAVFGGTAALRETANNAIDGKPLTQNVASTAVKEGTWAAGGGIVLRALARFVGIAPKAELAPEVKPTTAPTAEVAAEGGKTAAKEVAGTASSASSASEVRGGPYGHLEDGPFVGSGKDYTAAQKRNVLAENQKANGGVLRDDRTGEVGVAPLQSQKGVTPPDNEVHVDHWYPKAKGGPNSYSNAEVRLRKYNLKKSDEIPDE